MPSTKKPSANLSSQKTVKRVKEAFMRLDAIARKKLPFKMDIEGTMPPLEVRYDEDYEHVFVRVYRTLLSTVPVRGSFDGQVLKLFQAEAEVSDCGTLLVASNMVPKAWALTLDFTGSVATFDVDS